MSRALRPPSVLRSEYTEPPTTAAAAPIAHHQCPRNPAAASTMRVGNGSLVFRDLKKTSNLGSTKTVRTPTVTSDITPMMPG